ncbi:protein lev-9 [Caerostris extrusa]|uniref:Protein lev-9 n=1 Tax=Caerostris extrusa TaxID=172846 RepID=A0AAV4SBX2_CAEEX|nr:protein lev-9 [Caerostris extrusa]
MWKTYMQNIIALPQILFFQAICRGPPPLTANADLKSVNRTHEGGVVYVCKRYFDKKKHGNVTCSFGTWKGDAAVCKDSKCYLEKLSFPGLETKGLKNVYYRNQAVTATCKSGYNAPKENNRITCVDGEWEGHWPPCLAASCDSKDIDPSEGVILSDDEKTRYLNGEHLIVKCGEGLTPKFENMFIYVRQLQRGQKSTMVPSLSQFRSQSGLFFLEHRSVIEYKKVTLGGTKSPGFTLYVSCNRGYTFQGKGSNDVEVKCRGGKFYPNPVCLISRIWLYGSKQKNQNQYNISCGLFCLR